ncbi:hypothetical protein HDU93_002487 [Gonapodya sp. JEL0774]|nr:hypothetical protein HDU93_002487 [Gonapodya sp. JEL0774]
MSTYYPGMTQMAQLGNMGSMGVMQMNAVGGMSGMQIPSLGQMSIPQQIGQMPPMLVGPMGLRGENFAQYSAQTFQSSSINAFNVPGGFGGQFSLGRAASTSGGQFEAVNPPLGSPNVITSARQDQRTVYLGNLPSNASLEDLLNNVKTGMVEQTKILEEKNCAFVTFVDAGAAVAFYNECNHRHLIIHSQEIKVGWGKPIAPSASILSAVGQGASRNVFIGNIDDSVTDLVLREELSRFGQIDQIKVLRDKRIAFVHMAGIASAVKAVQTLQAEDKWTGRRINYGRDRCAPSKLSGGGPANAAEQQALVAPTLPLPQIGNGPGDIPPSPNGNRTVYLGGLPLETTVRELCDNIRGGILQHVKYFQEKGIGFVTFMSADSAAVFHHRSTQEGLVIHGKRLKIGWGKGIPIPQEVLAAVREGATRNAFVGNIDLTLLNEESLRREFQEFGEIEMINIVPDKSIAFINFTDIANAIKAVETKRADPNYSRYRVNYGKDRCANPPKPSIIGPAVHGLTSAHLTPTNGHLDSIDSRGMITRLPGTPQYPFTIPQSFAMTKHARDTRDSDHGRMGFVGMSAGHRNF